MDLEEVMGLQELEKKKDKFKIMITYVGGIAAQSVIKMIKKSQYKDRIEIIGTDCDKYSVGFSWVDKPYLVKKVPDCFSQYDNIVKKEKPDLILPTGEEDLSHLSKYENAYMCDEKLIELCQDKYNFHKHYKTFYGSHMPETELSWEKLDLPMVQKPITGRGSRGFELLKNAGHIAAVENLPMRIYQEYLPGQEYTIDVLLTDKTKIIVPRKRVNVKGGNSTCGKIELNRDIIMFLEMFFQDQSFRGPLCVQMKEDKDGKPKLTEINPRFGGGSIFTTIAGINFIDVILAEKFGDKLELEEPREITITRYWDEIEL
tara:strand:- start:778 stop:1725 length:948 start_codon:yes stop_codon:yes gene_type:complete